MGTRAQRAIVVALAVALAAAAYHARARSAALFGSVVADEDRYYLPPPAWLRAFSLGYNEAVADVLWVRTIVYFGERVSFSSARSAPKGTSSGVAAAEYLVNYLAVVTSLDPRFRSAYADGARLTLYHRGVITRRSVEMAIELLERGAAEYPDDGEIAFSLGFMNYYELDPFLAAKSAALEAAHEKGVRFIRAAAGMPGAPPYVSIMSSTLLYKEGLRDVVIEHLRAMLVQETDPGIRATLEAQLRRELGKAAEADIAAMRELERRWRRELPWAPFDLFLLVQPFVPFSLRGAIDPAALAEAPSIDEAEAAPDAGLDAGID
jgi:hypothetical protein